MPILGRILPFCTNYDFGIPYTETNFGIRYTVNNFYILATAELYMQFTKTTELYTNCKNIALPIVPIQLSI